MIGSEFIETGIRLRLLCAAGFLSVSLGAAAAPSGPLYKYKQRVVEEGVAVEWSLEPVSGWGPAERPLMEGEDVVVRFKITDDSTGAPIRGANPAAWMDLLRVGQKPNPKLRFQKASAFIEGNLFSQAEVDMNIYHVLALNNDGTITVVDPLFGFGSTKMLALPQLKSPGADWVLSRDQNSLFVSLPASMQVAVVNPSTWEVEGTIHTGVGPARLVLQPDEQYLWIANRGSGTEENDAGVTVVGRENRQTRTHIPTGADPVDIAFSDDSRYVFVANGVEGSVSVIDVASLRVLHQTRIGKSATSVAYSELAGLAYAIDNKGGKISGIRPKDGKLVVELQSDPGLSDIQFAPGGRFALIPNPEKDVVLVLDSSSNKIAHTIELKGRPSQITFSDLLVYVTHEAASDVSIMQIAHLGQPRGSLSFSSFPAGENPIRKGARGALASGIALAPSGDAVLVANHEDKVVYYYKEGMAAPMGTFKNYSRKPRAVLVVDRSLQERAEPGVYQTTVRLQKPGTYDTIFYLDAPRMVSSFGFDVAEDPKLARKLNSVKVDVSVSTNRKISFAKEPVTFQFRILDRTTKNPVVGLKDLQVLAFLAPGVWNERMKAMPAERPGHYQVTLIPPEEGGYFVHLQSPTVGLRFENNRQLILDVQPERPERTPKK